MPGPFPASGRIFPHAAGLSHSVFSRGVFPFALRRLLLFPRFRHFARVLPVQIAGVFFPPVRLRPPFSPADAPGLSAGPPVSPWNLRLSQNEGGLCRKPLWDGRHGAFLPVSIVPGCGWRCLPAPPVLPAGPAPPVRFPQFPPGFLTFPPAPAKAFPGQERPGRRTGWRGLSRNAPGRYPPCVLFQRKHLPACR